MVQILIFFIKPIYSLRCEFCQVNQLQAPSKAEMNNIESGVLHVYVCLYVCAHRDMCEGLVWSVTSWGSQSSSTMSILGPFGWANNLTHWATSLALTSVF